MAHQIAKDEYFNITYDLVAGFLQKTELYQLLGKDIITISLHYDKGLYTGNFVKLK